jgi:hypothetical protein
MPAAASLNGKREGRPTGRPSRNVNLKESYFFFLDFFCLHFMLEDALNDSPL